MKPLNEKQKKKWNRLYEWEMLGVSNIKIHRTTNLSSKRFDNDVLKNSR